MYLENDKLPSKPELLSFESLEAKYAEIRDNAMELAGAVGDVPRRASLLRGIYLETGGRHRFPLLGAHGVLWGHSKFQMAEKFIFSDYTDCQYKYCDESKDGGELWRKLLGIPLYRPFLSMPHRQMDVKRG